MGKSCHYLAMWDMYGLECLINVSQYQKDFDNYEKQKVISVLKEESMPQPPKNVLPMLLIRARFNMQRQYEIYEFTSTLSEQEIKTTFEESPQVIVDWLRKNGHKVYSDYNPQRVIA